MPLYEYQCLECQSRFERLAPSPQEADRPTCPQCGSKTTERRLSGFALKAALTGDGGETCACGRGGCGCH